MDEIKPDWSGLLDIASAVGVLEAAGPGFALLEYREGGILLLYIQDENRQSVLIDESEMRRLHLALCQRLEN